MRHSFLRYAGANRDHAAEVAASHPVHKRSTRCDQSKFALKSLFDLDGESPSDHTHLPGGRFSSYLYPSYEMRVAVASSILVFSLNQHGAAVLLPAVALPRTQEGLLVS